MTLFQNGRNLVDIIANQVLHHHIRMPRPIAQRQAHHRANMLFKLIHRAAVLRPVTRVMHPRRNLVHQQPLGRHKQLHPHYADIIQRIQDPRRDQDRIRPLAGRQPRRDCGSRQDPVLVDILARIIGCDRPIQPPRRNHRHLVAKADKPLQHRRRTVHRPKGRRRISRRHNPRLPLAIISQPRGFQNRRRADLGNRRLQIGQRSHRPIGRAGQAKSGQKILLGNPLLRNRQGAAVRANGLGRLQQIQRGGRDVLKLIGDDIDRGRKGGKGRMILIARRRAGMGHIRGRRVGRRLIDMGLVSQAARRDRQHAAQLPAAQNSDGRARFQHLTHPSAHPGSSLTKPRAINPALAAPAAPIAMVATG